MKGITHGLLGLACGFAVAATAPAANLGGQAGLILVAGIASLLPDIDHPKSIISGYTPGVGGAVRLFASHRTWTHSILFTAFLCLCMWFGIEKFQPLDPRPMIALAMGMLSHLAADMLTVAGVPLLLPISSRSFRLAPYPVLKLTSWLLESVATVGSVAVIGWIAFKGL